MRIIVTAGGTGGHIYPALAIINKLKELHNDLSILYIGTTDRMEATLVPSLGIAYKGIKMKGLDRSHLLENIHVYKYYKDAIKEAEKTILDFKPDVVVGVGGYITLPVIIAASKHNIKTFIHEQNSIPGLSNKILKKKATCIGVSLEDSLKYFKGANAHFTGNPRSEEAIGATPVDKTKYGLTPQKKLVLFVMGSLGSMTVTNSMKEIIPSFKDKDYEVLFVTGPKYFDSYKEVDVPSNVKLVPSLSDMLDVLKKTDLIVTRAGASTIAEITVLGVPSIMIPSPYVTHNHQEKNALLLEEKGCTRVIKEKELSKDTLLNMIDKLITDDKLLKEMSDNNKKMGVKDSSTKIAHLIEELVGSEK